MLRFSLLLPVLLALQASFTQDLGDRSIVLQEIGIPGMPGLQSFAWGQHNGEWLLIGGRTDGLHQRQPFAAFLASDNNTMAYVVNPTTAEVWSASLSTLPTSIHEQLQSTNMEFQQRGEELYIIGGYGYSVTANDHITHNRLSAVNVTGAIAAIKNGTPLPPHFRQISDPRMAVTGGYLGLLGDTFLLVGGQRFMGRYNPMGPDFGPGFVQEYTNAIRRFGIADDGIQLALVDFEEVVDTVNLHRRDYNLVPQIFPGDEQGFTAFSGVFQYGNNIPWLNSVDITGSGYTVVPVFEQLLNQYHTAHLPAYSTSSDMMITVFFGGIGRYFFSGNGDLVDDTSVPFVNTISRVLRGSNGAMEETAIGSMPALLGSGAEFILDTSIPNAMGAIIDLDALEGDTVLAGHIVGGIESSAPNIFFINTGTQSDATARVFRVLLVADGQTGIQTPSGSMVTLDASFPASRTELIVTLGMMEGGVVELDLVDMSGRIVQQLLHARIPGGEQRLLFNVKDLAPGPYLVSLRKGKDRATVRVIR